MKCVWPRTKPTDKAAAPTYAVPNQPATISSVDSATRKDILLQHAVATLPTDANKHTTHKPTTAMDTLPLLLVEIMVTEAHQHPSVAASVIHLAFALLRLPTNANASTEKN